MKILISGGHLTPALSLIHYAKNKKDEIVYVGRTFANKEAGINSREEVEIKNAGVQYTTIDSFKLNRHQKLKSLLQLPKLIVATTKALSIINTYKPEIIVSFGGYLAVPICIAGKIKRIPIFTHEQTQVIGLANKILFKIANKVGLSWENTKKLYPQEKYILTGNPIRPDIIKKSNKPTWLTSTAPILYVTGGSQGSKAINQTIIQNIDALTKDFCIIHQCGGSKENHYVNNLNKRKNKLPQAKKVNYIAKDWFSASELSWILDNALGIIGRSGANTITEIVYKKLPAILIPLPYAGNNEQYKNAAMLKAENAAILLPQLQIDKLKEKIEKLQTNNQLYRDNLEKIAKNMPKNPEEKIYQIIKNLHENQNQTPTSNA
jgi:UDP-N-acetylglucosamine--N-acetylmuramyl-(pentapeptide) pyrophosphoryl-undecaprenol N-acetylglucosamine transferase